MISWSHSIMSRFRSAHNLQHQCLIWSLTHFLTWHISLPLYNSLSLTHSHITPWFSWHILSLFSISFFHDYWQVRQVMVLLAMSFFLSLSFTLTHTQTLSLSLFLSSTQHHFWKKIEITNHFFNFVSPTFWGRDDPTKSCRENKMAEILNYWMSL